MLDEDLVKYSKKIKQKPKASDLFDGMVSDSKIHIYVTDKASEFNQIAHLNFCLKRDMRRK